MKKLLLFVVLAFPFLIAKAEPMVNSIQAGAEGMTINFDGDTEDCTAVMCKLYDMEDNELDKLSVAVDNDKYEGAFEVEEAGDYKVACANYEGGNIIDVVTTVKETPTDDPSDVSGDDPEAVIMYKLTVDLNGGTIVKFEVPTEVEDGTEIEFPNIGSDEILPPEGYVLDAFEVNGKRYEIGDKYVVTGDTEIKILWKKKDDTKNAQTFDAGITGYLVALGVSAIGIGAYFVVSKKKKTSK